MSESVWTRKFLPRTGEGVGFDRVVFFTDAVFAIALTLAAVETGVPEVEGDPTSIADLWAAIVAKGPRLLAFLIAFIWVAIYWLANHRFTGTLHGMTRAYVGWVVIYLALISALPIPASMFGEYFSNPLAVSLFAIYVCMVSFMELVLFIVADRSNMFVAPISPEFRRFQMTGSFSPLPVFLLSIPIALYSTSLAIGFWFVGSVIVQVLLNRYLSADPPHDPVATGD